MRQNKIQYRDKLLPCPRLEAIVKQASQKPLIKMIHQQNVHSNDLEYNVNKYVSKKFKR